MDIEAKKDAFVTFSLEKVLFQIFAERTTSLEEKAVYEKFINLYDQELDRLNFELTIASVSRKRANL
ncbi:hypothetical protein [Bacillus paranthracis]|uniref:hypothetical protein n=1 Tax=Bacillus paranthracis TaxID=2026186 RepID=UPI0018792941|nr:hypothetical protein [Bacillus paranthracis]MBE7145977.1 hypothetical protein [Bacillus paranthracis]